MQDLFLETIDERGRVLHLMACGGAPYRDLARIAEGDAGVVAAAMRFRSENPYDYSIMTWETVVFRLEGLLEALAYRRAA